MASLRSQTIPRRRIRSILLVPCLAFTLYFTTFYNPFMLDTSQSSVAGIITTTIVAPCVQTTVSQQTNFQADFQHEAEKPPQPHSFRSDGLLDVNPNGRHPVYDLIKQAEADWDKKMKRQSETLAGAAAEYRRRYHRAPPKGFDHWWSYCKSHNVQLVDEYDRIHNDLAPFWGVDPADLNRIQAQLETERDSYTIGKTGDSKVTMVASALPEPGPDSPTRHFVAQANEIADMLSQVSDFIPPFRATFSPHDNPHVVADWTLKAHALQAATAGTYIDIDNPPPMKDLGWASACSPESPLRRSGIKLDDKKTFIYDHLKAMDPCNHPSLLRHHGLFITFDTGPTPSKILKPKFSYCSTFLHNDIVPAVNWIDDIPDDMDPDFHERLDDRLSWRGSTTGIWHGDYLRWRDSQRIRLVGWAHERNGTASVLPPTKSRHEVVGTGIPVAKARLNPAMLDVAFVGKPHTCDPPICDVVAAEFEFRDYQGEKMARNYKYVLDVDGNGWSSRYQQLMASHSLIFKATVYPEWFTERIQPWVHYIPVKIDLSDLYDSLTFFRGDLYGEGAHEELASKIALAGRHWTKKFWREEDITAYMFRLFLEYARVMSLDREAMSYRL